MTKKTLKYKEYFKPYYEKKKELGWRAYHVLGPQEMVDLLSVTARRWKKRHGIKVNNYYRGEKI